VSAPTDSLELRAELLDTARAMNAKGINHGMSGNASVRVEGGFLITPSGMDYDRSAPEDLVFMQMDGSWQGNRKPSSEWRFHRDIYAQRSDAGAILHAHSPRATALACLSLGIPAFHYMVAMAGGRDIRCAPYATYGTEELSNYALEALEDRKACLLAHHGMIAFDQDLPRALALAVEVESLAGIYAEVRSLGEPVLLSDAEMDHVVEKFKGYGANAQSNA
jgi:L-fuculose-phosphate aldolase